MALTISKEIIQLDPEGIDFNDKVAVKALILKLLNVIEAQTQLIGDLQNENQSLQNEINRLKGEKGKLKSPPEMAEKKKDNAKGDKKKK